MLFRAIFLLSLFALPTQAAELLPNGDFQSATMPDGPPDHWPAAKGGASYVKEGENRYLHLAASKPDEMVMTYRQVRVPKDVKAIEMSWRQRTADLKKGKQAWFDARIMLQWKNAAGEKVAGKLPAPNTNKNSDWIEKKVSFLVPEEGLTLEIMPTLFRVEAGSFDIDDLSLKATDPAPIEAANKAKAEADAAKQAAAAEKRQANAAKNAGTEGELIANGNFQTLGKGEVPEKWGAMKENLSWETEGDNRFLRFKSPEAGKMVMLYRPIDLPKDAKALEFKWSYRLADFKRGKENYFDARILFQFLGADGKKISEASPAGASKNTEGWVDKSKQFLVPEGAVTLVLMPALFQAASGTLDLDNLSLKPVDPAVLIAAAEAKAVLDKAAQIDPEQPNPAKFPQELRVEGTKTLTKDGKEIWLQGVNVDSLQWNHKGERVMKSTLVAIDDWKANIIRLPIQETFWFGKGSGQTDGGKAYRELVDNVVVLAANRGAYTMLDLHRFRAPKREHVEFWKDCAAKYKNHPAVVFEVFNEPHGTSWEVWRNGGFVEDKKAPADEDNFLTPEEKAAGKKGFHSVGVQALVNAVRETGAKNVIIAGGLDWAYDLTGVANGFALDEKGGNGLMYAAHIYAQKRDWMTKVMCVADRYPIIVSECGANTKKFAFMPAEHQEDAATWVPRFLGFVQQHKLHWTGFSLHPGSAPMLIKDWTYEPTPEWGGPAKKALAGEKFPAPEKPR
ncbi:MAG TPA: glycoside hydrolase family 5 protein [Tepidisphaeraceae bacterium]|nr:glycoside hydrolase family 5 protein [Tepidisphaeraceae bacterium]